MLNSKKDVNNDQQAQEKTSRKTTAFTWFWRIVRFVDIALRVLDKLEGGE
ncbi:hypothetical protein ACPV52_02680 [Vibrio astriarenae]